jgi:hypothetical protein
VDSAGRRNTSTVQEDVAAQGRARAAILAGRPPLRQPGRPPVSLRAQRQRFWRLVIEGLSSEETAVACGVPMPLRPRWFREGGGRPAPGCVKEMRHDQKRNATGAPHPSA